MTWECNHGFIQLDPYWAKCSHCGQVIPLYGCGDQSSTIVTPPVQSIPIPTLESILYSQLPAQEKINKIISLVNETK